MVFVLKIMFLSIGILFFSQNIFSAEVDNFSIRELTISDSTAEINIYGNKLLQEVLNKLNKKNHTCEEKKLYKAMRKEFQNGYVGDFLKFIIRNDSLERIKIPIEKSIYRELKTKDSIILGFYAKKIYDPSAKLVRIGNRLIGTDKFEHFHGTGFQYFKSYYLEKKSIEETVQIGFSDEYGILGSWTTGVASFGDLAAEFNGMRFWNHMLQKEEDVFNENLGPYISCVDQKWVQVKNIDWSVYVDDSWDEAINCSQVRTNNILRKIQNQLTVLSKSLGQNITCPIDAKRLQDLEVKYGNFAPYTINNKGLSKVTKQK